MSPVGMVRVHGHRPGFMVQWMVWVVDRGNMRRSGNFGAGHPNVSLLQLHLTHDVGVFEELAA